jgi:hypothetical protein
MMLLGFGDASGTVSPTALYTDASGTTCRQYETSADANGNLYCDPCKTGTNPDGSPADMNNCSGAVPSVPTTITMPTVQMPTGAPLVNLPSSTTQNPVVMGPDGQPMQLTPYKPRWMRWIVPVGSFVVGVLATGLAMRIARRA